MFESIFLEATGNCVASHDRKDGVAFFKVAKSLYGLVNLSYLALNIPNRTTDSDQFVHCTYSDRMARQRSSRGMCDPSRLSALTLTEAGPLDWANVERLQIELDLRLGGVREDGKSLHAVSFPLPSQHGETAIFAVAVSTADADWESCKSLAIGDCRILANYFHNHVLRLNGHDAFDGLLVSARELDCLKWTAMGKTAWEASRILGISERTVRFHLNAAREKLNCTTTTQAVAKAVATQMFSI